jgi:integrase
MQTASPPTIRALQRAFTDLAVQQTMSAPRKRQYQHLLDELARAADRGDLPEQAGTDLTALLRPDTISGFLDRAEAGSYRDAYARPRPTAASTNRVRVGCLNRLAEAAGHPLDLPHRTQAPDGKPVTTTAERRALRAYLRQQNRRPLLDDDHARILVAIGLALDTGARSGELAAARLRDLDDNHTTIRLRRNPQRAPGPVPPGPPQRLSPSTRDALTRWLQIRSRLVAELRAAVRDRPDQGIDPYHDYLFVALAPNHAGRRSPEGGTPRRPVGSPLHAQGLLRALNRAAVRINAAQPTRRPLPSMEQLRRFTG